MRAVILRSLAVILVGGSILAVVLYVASTVDARPPEVLTISITQPVGDDPQVALVNTSIEVAFSEPVDHESAAAALRIEPSVDGTTSWSGSTLIFTPADPLELETEYEVVVDDGVVDLNGNVMGESVEPFAFTTAGRPQLVEADPADGTDDVTLDAVITLTFSTLMDTVSVEASLRLEPAFDHELRWAGHELQILPSEPLAPDRAYAVAIGPRAADAAGVSLGSEVRVEFRTLAPGLAVETIVPADGVDGIAVDSAIAVIVDRPIDPASVADGLLVIEPEVAGTLEVVPLAGEAPPEDDADPSGRMLRFTPSGPLPPNTTFAVELRAGLEAAEGGGLALPVRWTFTTGAPRTTISNQITFISDRSGVPNVWAMNPDGTGQRQLSAELSAVLDYAVAPDGSSLVVGDGYRLVHVRLDGDERRVLTDDTAWDFDATFAPDGQRVVFARADAATGEGLGLWTWELGGGEPTRLELPSLGGDDAASPDPGAPGLLRAPRFAPDGRALAVLDADGTPVVVDLDEERATTVDRFTATGPAQWTPDGGAVVLTGVPGGRSVAPTVEAPVLPLVTGQTDAPYRVDRSGSDPEPTAFGEGWRLLAFGTNADVAFVDADGGLGITDTIESAPASRLVPGEEVLDAAFAPDASALAVAVVTGEGRTRIEVIVVESGAREPLAESGERPRWQP